MEGRWALSYPPLGVAAGGTLALAGGSVLLGASLLARADAPRWLGTLLVVARLLVVPHGVLASFQIEVAHGRNGLAWVVVGTHLFVSETMRTVG